MEFGSLAVPLIHRGWFTVEFGSLAVPLVHLVLLQCYWFTVEFGSCGAWFSCSATGSPWSLVLLQCHWFTVEFGSLAVLLIHHSLFILQCY